MGRSALIRESLPERRLAEGLGKSPSQGYRIGQAELKGKFVPDGLGNLYDA
jgi:hypothetical protein